MTEKESVSELIYFESDRGEKERIGKLITGKFPSAIVGEDYDDIHEYRLEVNIEGTSYEDFWRFALQEKFAMRCLNFGVSMQGKEFAPQKYATIVKLVDELKPPEVTK